MVEDHQAAKGIVDATQSCGADLIVMGWHGRSGLAKMVLGSVAANQLITVDERKGIVGRSGAGGK